ncbi:MAG: ATP-binding cassette domain-containing protein [Nevskiaceae bacterium]|nr:MAG: ATP-binding cassette domain-containing protein [Nevskiaceae bacterium]TBR71842.1 MAG: ATP-binding cassette domain-containing protein [Nevskiaceae bacterium]
MNANPLLSAEQLRCTVGARTLWRDVNVAIRPGERWAVRGPSGSGKTLLLRTLAGLAPCQGGAVYLDGKPFSAWSPPAWRARVAYLPQSAVLPEGTVETTLAAPFAFKVHRGRKFSLEAARHYLGAVALDPAFLEQDTQNLSGGEAQLVALIRALLLQPGMLLLDEATASVDPARTTHVEDLIDTWLGESRDRACVWTSHDPAQLERVSTQSLQLERPA